MSNQTPLRATLTGQNASRMSAYGGGQASRMSVLSRNPARTPMRGGNDRRESIRDQPAGVAFGTTTRGGVAATPRGGHTPRGRRLTMNPHPTNDKKWQTTVIKNLLSVLEENGYPAQLTVKQLMSPTTREFQQIIQFLFQLLDENFEFGPKIDEDVITMMKALRYPFQISKASLAAPGAPTTWHNLLAVLQFLCELVEAARQNEITGLGPFEEYCLQTYALYMSGQDDFPELDAACNDAYEVEFQNRQGVLDEAKRKLHHLQELKQALTNADTLDIVQLRIADLERKKQKHMQYSEQMEEHLAKKQRTLDDKRAEANVVLTEAKTLRQGLDERQAILSKQKYSVADVQRIRQELQHYAELEGQQQAQASELEQKVNSLATDIRNKQAGVRDLAIKLNDSLRTLRAKTVDAMTQGQRPVEFPTEIDAKTSAADMEKLLDYLSQEVDRRAGAEKNRSVAIANQVRQAENVRDNQRQAFQERKVELEQLVQKEKKLAKLHAQQKETWSQNLQELRKEQDALQFKLHEFGSADPADSMGKMRLQQMEFDMQKELGDLEAEEQALDRQQESVNRQAFQYRQSVMEELKQFNKSLETKAGQVEQMARDFSNIELEIKQKVKHLHASVPQPLAHGQENLAVADKIKAQLPPTRERVPLAPVGNFQDDELMSAVPSHPY